MHSVSHSLVHRGPVASATRACRWQPYTSTSTSTQSQQNWTPNTPASSLSGSPSTYRPIHVTNPAPSSGSRPPLGRTPSVRDVQKSRYITALVDQAVTSLGEIWHPEDIPVVFTSTSNPRSPIPTHTTSMPNMSISSFATAGPSIGVRPSFPRHNAQLPSPVTPSTLPSPAPPRAPQTPAPESPMDFVPPTTVPLRSFVLEVLKRSKTSAGILQTALCYIAAIAHKVPVLAAQEHMGLAGRGEPCMEDFIVNGLQDGVEDLKRDLERDDASTHVDVEQGFHDGYEHAEIPLRSSAVQEDMESSSKTVRVDDDVELLATPDSSFIDLTATRPSAQPCPLSQRRIPGRPPGPSPPLPPLPPLPNPLLCPRRTFLAAVILASKFTQDKCFSNKAWARLAGLPAREISRCERALGAALEWRLWVGKLPAMPSTVTNTAANSTAKTLSRTKTVADMPLSTCTPTRSDRGCMGRSHTLPAHSFGEPSLERSTASSQPWLSGGHQNDTYPHVEISSSVTSDEGCLSNQYFAGVPFHASPSSMPTPGLSYSPVSTSSGDPTPMIRMADSDGHARSPAADGPWGLGGAVSGVSAMAFSVPEDLRTGARLHKPMVPDGLLNLGGVSCAYAWGS